MDRWWLPAVLAVLLAAPVCAQDVNMAGAETLEVADLYEDTQLLGAMRTLALSAEQLQMLGTLNAQLRAENGVVVALRAQLWQENHEPIEAVISAWTTGERLDPRTQRTADNAIGQLQEAQADLGELEAQSARTFLRELSDAQLVLVQSPEAAQALAVRTARMAGFITVGEYVAMELDAIRDLMADEYVMVAPAEARRVAANIIAQDAPDAATLDAAAAVLLQIMSQARAWTPPVYNTQREGLPAQIETALGIAGETRPVSYEDVLRMLRSERTPTVIALVTGSGGGEEQ